MESTSQGLGLRALGLAETSMEPQNSPIKTTGPLKGGAM